MEGQFFNEPGGPGGDGGAGGSGSLITLGAPTVNISATISTEAGLGGAAGAQGPEGYPGIGAPDDGGGFPDDGFPGDGGFPGEGPPLFITVTFNNTAGNGGGTSQIDVHANQLNVTGTGSLVGGTPSTFTTPSYIPEPSSALLTLLGSLALLGRRR